MKRKQRSREFWENAVEYAESSGETRSQCAKKLGVGEPALSYWVYKLRREREGGGGGELVPVRVSTSAPVAAQYLELDAARSSPSGDTNTARLASPSIPSQLVSSKSSSGRSRGRNLFADPFAGAIAV